MFSSHIITREMQKMLKKAELHELLIERNAIIVMNMDIFQETALRSRTEGVVLTKEDAFAAKKKATTKIIAPTIQLAKI